MPWVPGPPLAADADNEFSQGLKGPLCLFVISLISSHSVDILQNVTQWQNILPVELISGMLQNIQKLPKDHTRQYLTLNQIEPQQDFFTRQAWFSLHFTTPGKGRDEQKPEEPE